MRLLEGDEWIRGRRANHGVFFHKQFPGENRPRFTVIPDKAAPLPNGTLPNGTLANGTLAAILGPKQTGIGRAGLQTLLDAR